MNVVTTELYVQGWLWGAQIQGKETCVSGRRLQDIKQILTSVDANITKH